jgi:hypothetical protein
MSTGVASPFVAVAAPIAIVSISTKSRKKSIEKNLNKTKQQRNEKKRNNSIRHIKSITTLPHAMNPFLLLLFYAVFFLSRHEKSSLVFFAICNHIKR